ncbi:MAG: hypothetical protein AAF063_30060, partial [Cyanobacteria bacterium J06643_5]
MNRNPFVKFRNGKIVSVEHPTTASFNETQAYTKNKSVAPKKSGALYILALILVNAGIWSGAFMYLATA